MGRSRRPRGNWRPRVGRSRATTLAAIFWTLAAAVTLASCGSTQSTLSPHGSGADRISSLWWVMLIISVIVFVIVVAMLFYALFRRRAREDDPPRTVINGDAMVIIGGIVIPIIILIFVFVLTLRTLNENTKSARAAGLTIDVIARQWWWEVRYPGQQAFTTANEIHIPVDQPVEIQLTSPDVIHSFWVPELQAKMDVIPGHTNTLRLQADDPGTYRGQCAEFCGKQHAHMAFEVIAQPADQFAQWLATERGPAITPTSDLAKKGAQLFPTSPCAECHTIRGTQANGKAGPDLTHVGSRNTLAAGTIPNTPDAMARWISNSQKIKPGTTMPNMRQDPRDPFVQAIVAYLQSLK